MSSKTNLGLNFGHILNYLVDEGQVKLNPLPSNTLQLKDAQTVFVVLMRIGQQCCYFDKKNKV